MDEESLRDATIIYRTTAGRIGGIIVVGTYLFLAGTIAGSAWVLRKLWSHDKPMKKLDDGER